MDMEIMPNMPVDVVMEWDWSNKNAGHDWALTAYGNKGAVTVTHKGGLKTQHMPVAPAKTN
jgi:hypothetical protein